MISYSVVRGRVDVCLIGLEMAASLTGKVVDLFVADCAVQFTE